MITVVSSPGRSGTSLTMQMLQAAGLRLYWDKLPNRTEINPHGHYEVARYSWDADFARSVLPFAEGHVIKIQPRNLVWLTDDHNYQFITIERDPELCMASQRRMHAVMGKPESEPVGHLAAIIKNQLMLRTFTAKYPHCSLQFPELYNGAAQAKLGEFFHMTPRQVSKMWDCVDKGLWYYKAKGATA
jgi:hypothetical protein